MKIITNGVLDATSGTIYDEEYVSGTHTFMVEITGAPTAVSILVSGGIHGSESMAPLVTHVLDADELVAGDSMFHIINHPVDKISAQIIVLTGGTSPTVTVHYGKGTI